jgi:nitrite reductase/ring-hydroxylating ferredoxin subunit
MERREFLQKVGLGAAFALTFGCFSSCGKTEANPDVDLTIDLDAPANSALKTPGGYIVVQNVLVARTMSGEYVAATVICSHEQERKVTYDKNNNQFFCTAHGAAFDLQGKGLNSKGSKGLKIYTTSLSGNILKIK